METIKAVEMIRKIRDSQYQVTKNMTNEELIEYFRKKAKSANDEALNFINRRRKINN